MIMDFTERIKQAQEAINFAEYLIIGGGAGLSAAAGLHYSGKRFTDNFGPFIDKYGMEDMYTSSFYPFRTEKERWAYWAKHISLNRYETPATQLYLDLFTLAKRKNYFVITTNVDHQFYKAGFPAEGIFAVQGDYGFLQCAKGCYNKLYYNESIVKDMLLQTFDCTIPSELVPYCPACGGQMDVNLRKDQYFVEDEAWYAASGQYNAFVQDSAGKYVVYLELGVGFNTPGIIRYPFEQMTYQNPNATLIRVNTNHLYGAKENADKTISFREDMENVIKTL
jgi:NAD-dependent SIR2 family protein deacetylase